MPNVGVDPLRALPPELVLRIISLCDLYSVTRLERLSSSWKGFIAEHQGPIFSAIASRLAPDVIQQRNGIPTRYEEGDLAKIIASKWSPEHLTWGDVKAWREFCRRKLLLMRNLDSLTPRLSDRTINTGIVTTWRLRPDFEARTVVCTAHQGGLWVYDMDTGRLPLISLTSYRILSNFGAKAMRCIHCSMYRTRSCIQTTTLTITFSWTRRRAPT